MAATANSAEALIVSDLTHQSNGIKPHKPRGGRRPGAGRKPNWEKALRPNIKPLSAAVILAQHREIDIWEGLLAHPDARIRLDAIKYLTDRRDGKAKQSVEHLGPDGGPLQAAVLVKFVESDK